MKTIHQKLDKVERLAKTSKWGRFARHPFRYLYAFYFRKFIYPRRKAEKVLQVNTFFDKPIKIALPAATDIYLTGGKSHDSELRLARYLIARLKPGGKFMDIGAHYGYFSMLAAEMLGSTGQILAFEPTSKSYRLAAHNLSAAPHTTVLQQAVSEEEGVLYFYEFPNLYSEYNTTDITQFEGESWFADFPPTCVEVATTTIDKVCETYNFLPEYIKIDVEGAEFHVIKGGLRLLEKQRPVLIMEYLEAARHNEAHHQAADLLYQLGYQAFIIKSDGSLASIENIDLYLTENKLESDNIVFVPAPQIS